MSTFGIMSEKQHTFFRKNSHLIYAIIGWLIYLSLFFALKHLIVPKYFICSPLDDYIPFIKWFFVPYCAWYFYMGITLVYFGLKSVSDFVKLQSYIFIGFAICLLTYIIYPNAISFRPIIAKSDLLTSLMASMYSAAPSNMVVPSMHVFASVAVHISLIKSEKTNGKKAIIISSFIMMVLICASTVFVKQHSVIDIFWGALLALALYYPIYKTKFLRRLTESFQKKQEHT